MDIKELKNTMQADFASGHFKLQAIFDRHLNDIEHLLDIGMKHKAIHEELDLGITFIHYQNILVRARKKNKERQGEQKEVQVVEAKKAQPNHDKKTQEIPRSDIDIWIAAFNFSQPVKITGVLKNTIKTLEQAGWNGNNYHILKDTLSITTMSKLIDTVSLIRSSKFKKNVYKDNKACF